MRLSSLDCLRRDLKETDGKIVKLLNERALLSAKIGRAKAEKGLDVFDASQESKLFEYLAKVNEGALPEKYLRQYSGRSFPLPGPCRSPLPWPSWDRTRHSAILLLNPISAQAPALSLRQVSLMSLTKLRKEKCNGGLSRWTIL